MTNHPDTNYMLVKSRQAERLREAEEYRLGRKRPPRAKEAQPAAMSLRCRILAMAGGRVQLRALSLVGAEHLFAVCR